MGAVGLILVGLVASLFLGCILPSGNPIQRLTSGVFSFAKNKVVQRLFGARGVKAVEDFWHYVAWEPNPLLQIMYLFLVAGGFLIGFELAFVHVPNPYIPSYHKAVFTGIFGLLLLSFRKVSTTSPGYITHRNHHKYNRYAYDLKLYFPTVCPTEKFTKPPRSKFDRVTQRTVARFDHYCVWVSQPIGERNYKYFLLFLFMTSVYMLYAAIQVGVIFYHIMESDNLFNATFVNKVTGEEFTATPYILYAYISAQHRVLFVAWATCVVMGGLVTIFFIYHVYLAVQNITTNESSKISTFKRALKKAKKINDELRLRKAMTDAGKELPPDAEELPKVPMVYQRMVENNEPYSHHYNLGVWRNIKEILFPRCFEPDSKYPNVKRLVPPTVDSEATKQQGAKQGKVGTSKNSHGDPQSSVQKKKNK